MKRCALIVIALAGALAGVLVVSGTALAGKGGVPGPPTTTTPSSSTTTTQPTEPIVWTCQARVENGATAWHLGEYYEDSDGGHYRVPMMGGGDDAWPACIDLKSQHAGTRFWLIEWGGTLKKPMANPQSGLRVVFEAEVHSGTYLDQVLRAGDTQSLMVQESLCVRVPADTEPPTAPPDQAFVFVAMPWSGDKWTSSWVTLTPLTPDPDSCPG